MQMEGMRAGGQGSQAKCKNYIVEDQTHTHMFSEYRVLCMGGFSHAWPAPAKVILSAQTSAC